MTEKLGRNFRGKAVADRVMRNYVRVRQGRNAVILTEKQVRKLVRVANGKA